MVVQESHINLNELRKNIDKAAQAYYSTGQAVLMSDSEYDSMLDQLKRLCPDDPRLTRIGVPYQVNNGLVKAEHMIPMGSLDNVQGGIAGLSKWMSLIDQKLHHECEYLVSHKLDGISTEAIYADGKLTKVITRGNGVIGDDITFNAVFWRSLPTEINCTDTLVVRGEAILFKDDFNELNKDGEYENPRNLCSGIVGRLDSIDNDRITFIAFNSNSANATLCDRLDYLDNLGFTTVDRRICDSYESIKQVYDYLESKEYGGSDGRKSLPYEIDGVVIVVNDVALQSSLQTDPKDELRPKHSKALKFVTYKNITKVIGCEITIGHTGALIPTAKLEPVRIGGVTVENVLLNNWNEASANPSAAHIAIGDVIEVELAGDIIPHATRIVKPIFQNPLTNEFIDIDTYDGDIEYSVPTDSEEPKIMKCDGLEGIPTIVGIDGSRTRLIRPTIVEPDTWQEYKTSRIRRGVKTAATYVELANDDDLVIKAKIKHFIGSSRKGVGILGIGDSVLDALVEDTKLVRTPADLYRLKLENLTDLVIGKNNVGKPIKFGKKRALSLLAEIEKSKSMKLSTLLGSLGIDLLGERKAEILIKEHDLKTIDDWRDESKLSKINGDVVREAIINGLKNCYSIIDDLLSVGVTIVTGDVAKNTVEVNNSGSPFFGLKMCFTGTRECVEEVEKLGAIIKSGVSKGLDILVQKDPLSMSNKTQKAEELGIRIVNLDFIKNVLSGKSKL